MGRCALYAARRHDSLCPSEKAARLLTPYGEPLNIAEGWSRYSLSSTTLSSSMPFIVRSGSSITFHSSASSSKCGDFISLAVVSTVCHDPGAPPAPATRALTVTADE